MVKTFMVEDDNEFKELFWGLLKQPIKGSHALAQDEVPANGNLRKSYAACPHWVKPCS